MYKVDKIISEIKGFMKDHSWSKYKVASEAGLHKNTLVDIGKKNFNPTADTLRKCEKLIKKEEKK